MFPEIEARYIEQISILMMSIKKNDFGSSDDLNYLVAEMNLRLSTNAIANDYFDKRTGHQIKKVLDAFLDDNN